MLDILAFEQRQAEQRSQAINVPHFVLAGTRVRVDSATLGALSGKPGSKWTESYYEEYLS